MDLINKNTENKILNQYHILWRKIHDIDDKETPENVFNFLKTIFNQLEEIKIQQYNNNNNNNSSIISIDQDENFKIDFTKINPKKENCNCKNTAEKILYHVLLTDINNLKNINSFKNFFYFFHNEVNFKLNKKIYKINYF